MRIVQVSTLYPPELNSGGTLACHRLAVALRARGHDVSVFAGSSRAHEPPLDEKDWTYEGIPVRAINVASGYGHVVHNYRNASVAERFARYLAEATPDVVHFHSIQALGADVLEAARASGAGVVVTMHDAWFVCAQQFLSRPPPDMRGCPLAAGARQCDCIPGFDHAARRAFLDRALTHVDVVLAVSPFLAGILEANGVAPGKIRVCENGLPPPTPLPRVPSRRLRFGYLGGGHAWKGLGTLVSAVRELERDVVVDLYGVEREDWRVQAGGVELPRGVRLLPRFGPEDLPRMLARLDVVVVPSLVVESFSLVTREALQYGVPVIVSRSGGPESVVRDGENGLLFDRGDARGLRDAMRRFADDPGLLERTRRAAGQTPIATVEQQAEHVAEVYAEVATPRPPRARPLPRSVLFVAGMEGAPFRYRVGHLAAALRDAGVRVETRLYHDEEVLGLAGEHEIVVLNRVPWDPYVSRVVARARQAGAVVVFGVDDLIFDPELDIPALHVLPRDVVERYRAGVKLFRATLDEADAFLGSTPALADAARALGKRALVVPNTLDPELVARSDAARTRAADARGATPARGGRGVRIGYFSGTDSHDRDFAIVAEPLATVMREHPDAVLVVGGHLSVPDELDHLAGRIERLPFVPWRELPDLLASLDVNLAPLELGYAFNEAKSALKWFEAAAVAVPTIASPTRPYRDAVRDGVDGLLAATAADWTSALRSLVADPERRAAMGRAARDRALEHHGPDAGQRATEAAFRELAASRARPLRNLPPVEQAELAAVRAAGIAIGRAALEPADAVPGPAQVAGTALTPCLGGAVNAVQPVYFPDGVLRRVDLLVATYGRTHHHDLVLRVVDVATGADLARHQQPGERACDNAWFAFELPGVPTQQGRQLALVVEATAASGGISLYCQPAGWPRGAGRSGSLVGIDLAYRTWMAPGGAEGRTGGASDDVSVLRADLARSARELRELTQRLNVAEARLAVLATPRPRLWARVRQLAPWRGVHHAANGRAAVPAPPPPSLPYRAMRRIVAWARAGADDAEVETLIQDIQGSLPYRAARRAYRGLRRR